MPRDINITSDYHFDAEDMKKLVEIHTRLADESRPLCGDERRDLHLRLGLIIENAVEVF